VDQNNLVITFEPIAGQKLDNLLPTEINRCVEGLGAALTKAVGRDWIGRATFEFQGKTHNVTNIKAPVGAGA